MNNPEPVAAEAPLLRTRPDGVFLSIIFVVYE